MKFLGYHSMAPTLLAVSMTVFCGSVVAQEDRGRDTGARACASSSVLQDRVLEEGRKGADALRQFVHRTRMIYELSQADCARYAQIVLAREEALSTNQLARKGDE